MNNMDQRKEKVVKTLKMYLVIIIIVMVFEALMMISYLETPMIDDLSRWKDKLIYNYFCDTN